MFYDFEFFSFIMLEEYLKLLILLLFLLIFVIILFVFALYLSKKNYDVEKNSPYECGFNPFEDAREPFEIHFYLVSILFIIFDLEISFLIPWVVVFRFVGLFGYLFICIFLFVLTVGFVYEIRKGGLDWN
jgi:NADH-quinone oxidoreductase subunit A